MDIQISDIEVDEMCEIVDCRECLYFKYDGEYFCLYDCSIIEETDRECKQFVKVCDID